MAASNANGFGAYERMLAGWLIPNATTLVRQSWTGTVSISPLEQPNGDTLALILSTQTLLPPGTPPPPSPGPGVWTGYMVECRREIVDDLALPSAGVLVTYFNTTRLPLNRPALVVRRTPGEAVGNRGLQPGGAFSNGQAGVRVTYTGDAPNGSCMVSVNLGTQFVVTSVNSGLVLDVPAFSKTPGTDIQQWTGNGGTNQLWTLSQTGGAGGYQGVSVNSGLLLDVANSSKQPGAQISREPMPASDGHLKERALPILRFRRSTAGYSSTLSSKQRGGQIQQWSESGRANQLWNFTPLDGRPTISIAGQSGSNITITGKDFSPYDGLHSYYMGVPEINSSKASLYEWPRTVHSQSPTISVSQVTTKVTQQAMSQS